MVNGVGSFVIYMLGFGIRNYLTLVMEIGLFTSINKLPKFHIQLDKFPHPETRFQRLFSSWKTRSCSRGSSRIRTAVNSRIQDKLSCLFLAFLFFPPI
jgi:hypothetical protein